MFFKKPRANSGGRNPDLCPKCHSPHWLGSGWVNGDTDRSCTTSGCRFVWHTRADLPGVILAGRSPSSNASQARIQSQDDSIRADIASRGWVDHAEMVTLKQS